MFYRETGQFKTNYAADRAIFPIRQDRWAIYALLLFTVFAVPFVASNYLLNAILMPLLVFSLAALGLNILTGYAGQVSFGAAAFMGIGAYISWNVVTRIPGTPVLIAFIVGGLASAAAGIVFGLPSLRIKGFYLAVTTLAAQFISEWAFTHIGWLYNYDSTGSISTPEMVILGFPLDTPLRRYYLVLLVVLVMALAAKNMMRNKVGRDFMAVRDMDVAAEVIGIPMMRTKLLAFAISSFYLGVAGALFAFAYLRNVEALAFEFQVSLRILFMIIIGGMGSIMGSFIGAAFIVLLPITMNIVGHAIFGDLVSQETLGVMELMIFGGLMVFFLIVEPLGIARMWQIVKEKLRIWPFPH